MFGFQYSLLSPHYASDEAIPLFNKAYKSWEKSFTKVLVEDAGGALDPDDFFRCDYMGLISHNGEIVGHSLLTLFDLRLQSTLEHHYIKTLTPETIETLLQKKMFKLVSAEYLTILPEWRKSHAEVPWAEILMGLSLKTMDESHADALIGMPRIDIKVDQACKSIGGYEIQAPVQKMKYPCAILAFDKNKDRRFQNPITDQYVQGLWKTFETQSLIPFNLPKVA